MYFKEIKRKKTVFYIYLHIFHFQCSSFLSENLQFHLGSFTFQLKPSFSFSCTTRLLAINSLSFHLSEIFYFPQFLKNIFTGYRSMGWQVPSSFQHCEDVSLPSDLHYFWWKLSHQILWAWTERDSSLDSQLSTDKKWIGRES